MYWHHVYRPNSFPGWETMTMEYGEEKDGQTTASLDRSNVVYLLPSKRLRLTNNTVSMGTGDAWACAWARGCSRGGRAPSRAEVCEGLKLICERYHNAVLERVIEAAWHWEGELQGGSTLLSHWQWWRRHCTSDSACEPRRRLTHSLTQGPRWGRFFAKNLRPPPPPT